MIPLLLKGNKMMRRKRSIGLGLALAIGLLGGVATSAAAAQWLSSGEELLTAKQCPSGLISVGDVTYQDEVSSGASDEAPAVSRSVAAEPAPLDVAPPEDLKPAAAIASPAQKAQRWLEARPDLAQAKVQLAAAEAVAGGHQVVDVAATDGAPAAQLIFEEHNGTWRIGSILECAR